MNLIVNKLKFFLYFLKIVNINNTLQKIIIIF